MPLTVTPVVWSFVVYHDSVPPIMHISTSHAGIAKMYTHLGSPSNDLSSLVKMSISSFIIVIFWFYCALLFRCKVLGAVGGLEPPQTRTKSGDSPSVSTTHRIYIPSYKQLAATPAYAIRRRAHPHYWTCNQDSVFQFVLYVAIMSQPFGLQFSQLPSDLHYYLSVCCGTAATKCPNS
jgi:hypothetical protein